MQGVTRLLLEKVAWITCRASLNKLNVALIQCRAKHFSVNLACQGMGKT